MEDPFFDVGLLAWVIGLALVPLLILAKSIRFDYSQPGKRKVYFRLDKDSF